MSPPPMQHTLIRASAGTGKTFALSNRYLALLCGGAEVEEVLATTFTRKAAAQILDRVLVRLAAAALDDARCAELAEQIEVPELTRAMVLSLTVSLLKNLDRLQVMTLDSFFAKVGGRFALEMELPAGWTIIEELDDASLRQEAIEDMLAKCGDEPILRLLHLMTKGEARRSVAQLIHDTVSGLYSLYRESGREAWRKLERPTPLTAEVLAKTIEELRAASLVEGRQGKPRDRDVELASAAAWDEMIGAGLCAKVLSGENSYYKKPIPEPVVAIYKKLIDHVRSVELRKLADQTEATGDMLHLFDSEYRRLKKRDRMARFEDVTEAVGKAGGLTGGGELAWRLESDVRHLLLDEFQDTSLPQWQAVRPLAERLCQPGSAAGSVFAVGDVKQAIYGWRGGVAEIFDTLTRQVAGLAEGFLNESYRSAQPIVDTVNRAFGSAMHQNHGNLDDLEEPVAAWCTRFPSHTTAKKDLAGYAVMLTAPPSREDDDDKGVAALRCAAQKIAELKPRIGNQSIGVLVRSNRTVARMIHELRKLHVDASEEGGNPLTDSAAVGTVLSLLRLADHPGDTVSAYHVAHSPLGAVVGLADHRDPDAVCALARRVRRDLLLDGYGATIGRLCAGLAPSCDSRELFRLRQLTEAASDYDRVATLRCDDFVARVEQTRRQQAVAASVRVMTVHQAKGLEFDAVVLPDLDVSPVGQSPAYVAGRDEPGKPISTVCLYRSKAVQCLLPESLQNLFNKCLRQDVDEGLSLLYVMLTRARHALYMIVRPSDAENGKLHKTFAGLLRASLAADKEAPPESVLYACGEQSWYCTQERVAGTGAEPLPGEAAIIPRRSPGAEITLTLKLATSGKLAARATTADSPSHLEGGPRRTAESLLRTDGEESRWRGSVLHAWFEQIGWLDDAAEALHLNDDTLRKIARRLCVERRRGDRPGAADVDDLIAQFRRMLARKELREALSRSSYRKFGQRNLPADVRAELEQSDLELALRREGRIAAKRDGRLIGGQADRIVVLSRGGRRLAAEVVDFKTDRFDADDPSALKAKVEFYRPQLAAYCDATAQMYRLDRQRVCARLLFVESGVMAEV